MQNIRYSEGLAHFPLRFSPKPVSIEPKAPGGDRTLGLLLSLLAKRVYEACAIFAGANIKTLYQLSYGGAYLV